MKQLYTTIALILASSVPTNSTWAQACPLDSSSTYPDKGYIFDFNVSSDISGEWAAVGTPEFTEVQILHYENGEWVEFQTLQGPSLSTWYAHNVSISGDRLVVGLPGGYGPSRAGTTTGSVYSYSFDGTEWTRDQIVHASDFQEGDRFGEAVAVDGDVLAIGSRLTSSSTLYIFEHDGTEWVESASFALSFPVDYVFQGLVDVDGERVAVGIPGWDRVEVFSKQDGVWGSEQIVETGLAGEYSFFGNSVSLSGETLAVGAHEDNSPGGSELGTGAVHIFSRDNTGTWVQTARILPENPITQGSFGFSLSMISEDAFVVGQPAYSSTDDAAYIYLRGLGGQWEAVDEMKPDIISANYRMGYSVAADQEKAVVLERIQQNMLDDAAKIHFYDFNPEGCRADLTGDCSLDFFDLSVFLTYYQLNDLIADFFPDGQLNFFDINVFLSELTSGC